MVNNLADQAQIQPFNNMFKDVLLVQELESNYFLYKMYLHQEVTKAKDLHENNTKISCDDAH